jgi:hypothetical protein
MREYSSLFLGLDRQIPKSDDEDISKTQKWLNDNTETLLNAGLPSDYVDAAQATGLIPLEEDISAIELCRSLNAKIEAMHDNELAEAESLAVG